MHLAHMTRRSALLVVAAAALSLIACTAQPSSIDPAPASPAGSSGPLMSDGPVDTSPPPLSTQIVGGSAGSVVEFPWIVALLDSSEPDPYYAQFCGGAIVSQTKILTAAHCVVQNGVTATPSSIDILYGTSTLAPESGSRRSVTGIAVHPSYSEVSGRNDLAVLTVAALDPAGTAIEVITPEAENNTMPGRVAKLAGWGCTDVDPNIFGDCVAYPQQLRRTNLTIQSTATCNSTVPDFHAPTMLCAGSVSNIGAAPDACYGDSGGPLSVPGARATLLAGLVSFGPGCGGAPTAYTRLATYRSWLAANGVPLRAAPFSSTALTPQVGGTYRPVTGDFNGDGRSDVYWYAPGTATDSLWLGSPSGPVPGPATRQVNGTYTPIVGDVDDDGDDDLFWYAPGTGPETLWRGSPSGTFSTEPGRAVNGSYVPVVGDLDAAAGDDIYWYGSGPAADALWLSAPAEPTSFTPAAARAVNGVFTPAVGDFNGDGGDDIYWYAPGTGADYLWRSSPTGPAPGPSVLQLNGTYQLLPGDFDGDGRDDLFGYGPGTAMDLIWRGAVGGFDRQTDVMVNGTYRPATGDLNGDGRDDVLWHGPGSAADSWFAGVNVP